MRQTRTRAQALLAAGLLASAAGCAARSGAVAEAVVAVAVAATAATAQRSGGGCWATCPPGTVCNRTTGYCDERPCRGQCTEQEWCDAQALIPRCVRRLDPALELVGTGTTGILGTTSAPLAAPSHDAGR